MLQVQYSHHEHMMGGPSPGSQIECGQEYTHRTAYTSPTSPMHRTPPTSFHDSRSQQQPSTAPRTEVPPSASRLATPPHTPSDDQPTLSDLRGPSTAALASPPSSTSAATQNPAEHITPTHTRNQSTVPSNAPSSSPSPSRHPRRASLQTPALPTIPPPIRLRDLAHVVEIANAEAATTPEARARSTTAVPVRVNDMRFEISSMPVPDVIEMVAALLTKITTTNDQNHPNLHRSIPPADGTSSLPAQTTSVLAFHGRNVPTITIQSYLSRIHKYCPTTYEVFLSLLVYFDRMTERVNPKADAPPTSELGTEELPPVHPGTDAGASSMPVSPGGTLKEQQEELHRFVVDSFNIHRLVIAGVTCASKFFSDVFYTNSRYAKVGGLPLVELNHLELQFLLLNDFRLSITVESLEDYGTMLVQFYAREAVEKQPASTTAA